MLRMRCLIKARAIRDAWGAYECRVNSENQRLFKNRARKLYKGRVRNTRQIAPIIKKGELRARYWTWRTSVKRRDAYLVIRFNELKTIN